jgi:phosphomannomutase
MLRGDETGVLLGDYVLSTTDTAEPLVATTIVSSSMLAAVAAEHGARYTETLTGFKWLARAGEGLVYAYEEALGLCVNPGFVRDKDGIAAAVLACDLAATLKAQGRGLPEALDELAARHGVYLTDQVSLRVDDLSVRGTIMARLRSAPPTILAGVEVRLTDLLPEADVLRLHGPGVRVIVRPSGTEPKLKTYLEVVETETEDLAEARARADERLAAVRADVQAILRE